MIKAAIDIGTNTVLLLLAEVNEGELRVLYEEQRTPRLGRGVDASKNLHPDSVERVIDILKEYVILIDEFESEVSETVVTATSAVRDASNREVFMQRIRQETGFEVLLLSGKEEANYTHKGALSVLPKLEQTVVIDIGGGSTEVIVGNRSELIDSHSFDIGSVRFTERYLKHNPPIETEMEACREAVENAFKERPLEFGPTCNYALVGVAGTVTSLAFLDMKLETYNPKEINGFTVTDGILHNWIKKLSAMTAQEIELAFPEVMKGRADVILGGLLILEGFMKHHSFAELVVSTGGIRHGAILHTIAATNKKRHR